MNRLKGKQKPLSPKAAKKIQLEEGFLEDNQLPGAGPKGRSINFKLKEDIRESVSM